MMESAMDGPPEDGGSINVPDIAIDSSWAPHSESRQNILYITVGYSKDASDYKLETDTIKQEATYNDFEPHVSPLDPNMSSVARYSPVYTDSHPYTNPVVVTQLVSTAADSSDSNFVCALSNSESNNINNADLQQAVGSRFLQMVNESDVVHSDASTGLPLVTDSEQEVELLITDQTTGISYSVSTQQYLVDQCLADNQQLLEALAPDPLLESDLLTLDENTLKSQLSEIALSHDNVNAHSEVILSKEQAIGMKYESNEAEICKSECLRRSQRQTSGSDNVDNEDQLLSCVHTITDKPVPSRARATLPENYLTINKLYEGYGVFAKKLIPKSSQFGPLEGILITSQKKIDEHRLLLLLEVEADRILQMDISDENTANWMCYVRRANTYSEQNLVLMQQGTSLFYVSTKTILPKQELMVGYSVSYAQRHNLQSLSPPVEERNTWHCFECSQSFSSSKQLQRHLNIHDERKDENGRLRKRLFKKKMFVKKRQKTETLQCNECKESFVHPKHNVLKLHMLSHGYDEFSPIQEKFAIVKYVRCEECNIGCSNEEQLNQHRKEAHESDCTKKNVCPKCNIKFETVQELHSHSSLHTQESIKKTYRCPICYKIFANRDRMQRHMLVHGSEDSKPYVCDKCAKRFLSTSALACHRKTHFIGRKVFECPICKESFVHVLQLKQHTEKHCIDGKFTCPFCSKIFYKYSIIRKHIRGFHCERRHACPDCTKSFPTLDKLRMHQLRHSDHREFLCADCGTQFKRKDKLKEHAKRMHSEERENSAPVDQGTSLSKKFTPKVQPTDYHRFIYKCHTCMVGFKRRGMLVNHLAKRHPEISPDTVPELNLPILRTTRDYYCQYCDKVYKSSSKRKAHILKNHPGAELPISNRKMGTTENPELPNATYSHAVGSITTHPQACQWCHKQYASKAKLLQHQRKKHTDLLDLHSKAEIKSELFVNPNATQNPVEEIAIDTQCFKRDFKVSDDLINEMVELDEVRENSQYYHLVSMSAADGSFPQPNELNGSDSRLYRLLTTGNNMVPPR